MGIRPANLFRDIPASDQEWFQTLLEKGPVRIERIVSRGHASPAEFWYDQDWDEWVLLLQGEAGLVIQGEPEIVLAPGDFLFIPAGVRHRVAWTASGEETVWLAVHLTPDPARPPG